MLNYNDISSMRATILSLADQYEELHNSNVKLQNDCKQIKEFIDNQVQQIREIHENFEKLKKDYIQQKNNPSIPLPPVNEHDLKPELDIAHNDNAPVKEDVSESEVDYQIKLLVPSNEVKHPLNIVLFADIVELTVVCCTSFSPDGSSIAIGSDKALRIYNIDQDSFIFEQSLDHSQNASMNNHIRSISWTPDSKCIICGTEDSRVRIYQVDEGLLLKKMKVGSRGVFEIQVAKTNEYFAAVTGNGDLSLYSMADYKLIRTFEREVDDIIASSLSISEDGSLIAVGYSDFVVGLWDPKLGQLLFENKCHNDGIFSVKFIPGKNNKIVTSSLDSTIKFWDILYDNQGLPRLSLSHVLKGHTNSVLSLSINAEGTWLLSGSKDMTVKLTDIETATMIYDIQAHKNSVISVSFSPSDKHFCTGSGDRSIKIWEIL